MCFFFFFSSRRRHTRWPRDWSSDVCSSDLSFVASAARRKGLSFVVVRRMREVYERAIALVSAGAVDVGRIVSDRYPLDKAAEAMADAVQRNGIKTVVLT